MKLLLILAIIVFIAIGALTMYVNELFGLVSRTNERFNKVIEMMQPYVPPLDGWKVFERRD